MNELKAFYREGAALETAPTRTIESGGIRFAYRRLGPSIGTPLVLLQHFSGNIDAWDPAVVNALAARHFRRGEILLPTLERIFTVASGKRHPLLKADLQNLTGREILNDAEGLNEKTISMVLKAG